jgi:hypothetical protein
MEDKVLVNNLLEKAESYGKTTLELIKLKTVDKVADGTSSLVAWFAVIVALILFFTALNIGIALLIGDMLGKSWLGFFVVAGFYALIALILYIFRNRWIKKPVGETIINQLLN